MSNQLSIQAALPLRSSGDNTVPLRGSAPAQSGAPVAKPVRLFVNPSFQFDPTVGIAVIQFHDNAGNVTNTIPSQRQLAAYRQHEATPGEQPPPVPKTPQLAQGKTSAG